MNRAFSNLFPLKLQPRIFSHSCHSFHLLPPKPKSVAELNPDKFRLSCPIPIEELSDSHRGPPATNASFLRQPSKFFTDNNIRYLAPFHPGNAESLHLRLIKEAFPQDLFLSNNLVNMYAKAGFLDNAQQVFDEMPERNAVSWTCLISGYNQQGLSKKACHIFKSMLSTGLYPSDFTLCSLLQACRNSGPCMLPLGVQIHAIVLKSAYSSDSTVCNSLISMYGTCCLEPERYVDEVFRCTPTKDTVTWNSIISVHAQNGDAASAFALFSKMQERADSSLKPNEYTFGSLIAVSYASISPYLIEQMLGKVSKTGFLCDIYVGSAMVSVFSRYGQFETAREVFRELSEKNSVSVNGLMTGLVQQNHGEEALEVFREAGNLVNQNCDSHLILLSAMSEFQCLDEGRRRGSEIHGYVIRTGLIYCKVVVYNGLVNMYSKCGDIKKALSLFKCMSDRDQVSWNSILSGLDQNGQFEEALTCFADMLKAGVLPSNFAIISSLSSCSSSRFLGMGSQLHGVAAKVGLDTDISVSNSLISMYGECGSTLESWKIFNSMSSYDQISWNSMLGVLASSETPLEDLLTLFSDMMKHGWRPNTVTFMNLFPIISHCSDNDIGKQLHTLAEKSGLSEGTSVKNSLIFLYANSGDMQSCEYLFTRMSSKRDIVSWNNMVAGYLHNGLFLKATELVCLMMVNGYKMDCFTFTSVLSTYSSVSALERGMETHAFGIRSHLISDVVVESALLDMYSKCGKIENASKVFNSMALKNEYSWNAMISGYARHGQGSKALELFKVMQDSNLQPDHVTFVGVLSACSHSCLVEEGLYHFKSMDKKYNLVPEIVHYSCVVDLLGRAGEIEKMEEFVEGMPITPNGLIWRTVLGACCRSQNGINTNLYKKASDMLVELEPLNPGNYVLMSNLYASKGRWEGVAMSRISLRGLPMKREVGCSWVTLRDGVHVFQSGDRSHPDTEKIYEKMDFLKQKLKEAGYVPRTEFAWYNLEVEIKEEMLIYHSEKLAVAFVLTRTSGVPIRIMKNLRVCGDCHLAFCYISKIVERQIVLRDYNRFHHFEAGRCSCGDFW